jgi:hypothetical protein
MCIGIRALVVIMFFMPLARVQAETVHLKNGDILKGRLEAVNGDVVRVDTQYGALNVSRDSILTIDFRPEGSKSMGGDVATQQAPLPVQSAPQSWNSKDLDTKSSTRGTDKYNAVKIGLDTSGEYSISGSVGGYDLGVTDDVSSAVSVSYENVVPIPGTSFYGGAGVNFQFKREFSESDAGFQFFSGYLVGKIPIEQSYDKNMFPYVVCHLGGGLGLLSGVDTSYDVSLRGGLYYGAGLELNASNFGGTILYAINKGTLNVEDVEFDVEYKRISLFVSYRF